MRYTKLQVIDLIFPAIFKASKSSPEAITNYLKNLDQSELESMLQKQIASGLISTERLWSQNPQTPQSQVTWQDVEKARQLAEQELAEARQEAADRQAELEAERYADFLAHQDRLRRETAPQREAQLKQDRITFAQAARKIRSFGVNEANLGLLREALGDGFDVYAVQQAVDSGAVSLSPASQSELDQWAAEDIQSRNEYLKQADVATLKKIVREQAEAKVQSTATKANDDALKAQQQRDSHHGYPELPGTWLGRPLDATFIRQCDVKTHKLLSAKFGSAQLTARLQGKS